MKVCIFGCKSSTIDLINFLKKKKCELFLVTIEQKVLEKNHVAGFFDLSFVFEKSNTFFTSDYSLKKEADYFINQKFDIGFVMGWQRLIPKEILETFSIGVFGMHGSSMNLPEGRGRSPLNWSLIEGRKIFYTNLFKYEPGVDDGKILERNKFQILETDTAETLHFKNTLSMLKLIDKNWNNLVSGKFDLIDQDHTKATYYPKRTPKDSYISLEDDIFSIERFIRAVSEPFGGAKLINECNSEEVIIHRASVFDFTEFYFENADNGKIVHVFQNEKFLLKLKGGILIVHQYEGVINVGDTFTKKINSFERFLKNTFGRYDLKP